MLFRGLVTVHTIADAEPIFSLMPGITREDVIGGTPDLRVET
jgi:hypothetical protein